MEINITIKHLSGYLSYELKVSQPRLGKIESYLLYGFKYSKYAKEWTAFIDDSRHGNYQNVYLKGIKPILRPLSDLTKEIEVNGEKFVPSNWFGRGMFNLESVLDNNFTIVQKLYEWHFDIHGLIEKGLAIDINTLAK